MPTPLRQYETRLREHGRIRIGKQVPVKGKPGKMAPASIDTFRFTSADREAIVSLAAKYGGEVKEWNEPKANPPKQWQVETPAAEIDVWLPAGCMSQWYELHGGGGLERRCDGETVTVPMEGPNQSTTYETGPCICERVQREECKAVTRINVILPDVRFGGQWRLETKGWNASHELPGVVALIEQLQVDGRGGIIKAKMVVERRTKMVRGKKQTFVVPGIFPDATPMELLFGQASIDHIRVLDSGEVMAELPPATPVDLPTVKNVPQVEEVIVEDLLYLCDELSFKQAGLGAGADVMKALITTAKPGASELTDIDDTTHDRLVAIVKACLAGTATIKLRPNGTVEVKRAS
jgi:hypothetical protein